MTANRALQAAGLMVDELELGRLIRCKTAGDKGGSRSGWYFCFDDGGVSYGDWRSGFVNHWQPDGGKPSWHDIERVKREREAAKQAEYEVNAQHLGATWSKAHKCAPDGLIDRYLQSRGLSLCQALRGGSTSHWHDGQNMGYYPTMLAAVQAPSGRMVNIHRTYLRADGAGKADLPIKRKLMGSAGPMTGAAIRLMPHTDRLGIAEGIETALSASMLFDVPVWAAVSAHGLAGWAPPKDVKVVDVFADHDSNQTGQQAAEKLANRLALAGLVVRVHTPPKGDWNDVLMGEM